MHTLIIKLRADELQNPDLDIRYVLPDLLAQHSGGVISDDGYDYVGDAHDLVLFLKASDLERATACIIQVITTVSVLGNDLRTGAVVAVDSGLSAQSHLRGMDLPRPSSSGDAHVPKTLLAVDDSATMRKVLEITFSGEDFTVLTADSSQAALANKSCFEDF